MSSALRRLRVARGSGTDSSTDLYWDFGTYVWNDGNTVFLYDDTGTLHTSRSY